VAASVAHVKATAASGALVTEAELSIERTEFTSGLRIITDRMPGVRSAALGFWVGTGSRDEVPRISGASHFLEHLLFKGTPSRSARDFAEAFDAVGGDFNAFTTRETTCFYARVVDKDLGMAVESLCDMFQNSLLRKPDFEAEKQVILEEIHMYDDTPDDLVHDLLMETLWPGHPLGRPVLGTVASITAMSRDQVHRFYRKRYEPKSLIITVAGNIHHEDVVHAVRRFMDTGRRLPKRATGKALLDPRSVPMPSGLTSVRDRPTEQAHICVGTNGLSRRDPDRVAFGIVNDALGGGMSSRLFQEIREKRGLAYSVYSYHSMFAEAGLFGVFAGTTPAHAFEVLDLVHEQLEDVAVNGIREDELERAKGHVKGSLALSLEETSGRMMRLGRSEIGLGEILTVSESLRRVDAVTIDDTRRVAERVLKQPRSVAVIGPFADDAFEGVAR
jgi:predicted Zn-dependent peptidase